MSRKPRAVKTVRAGGGVVTRRIEGAPRILLIRRRGVWDLPKGKLDRGESIAECAEREVREELGIDKVSIVEPLGTTRHEYREGDRLLDKTTWWFLMRTDATSFEPQASEQIDAVAWVHPDEAVGRLAFDTLRDLVRRHRHRLLDLDA